MAAGKSVPRARVSVSRRATPAAARASPAEPMTPAHDQALHIYRTMLRIRAFEEKASELFLAGRLPGFLHAYVGQEAVAQCSFASEVAALVAEEAPDCLDAPIRRVTVLDTPMPFSQKLERFVVPSEERLIAAASRQDGLESALTGNRRGAQVCLDRPPGLCL